tara:strand:+ start:2862 stop:4445 length:1584 start_codon:yes stop_codon:yes gene_type:complete
VRPAHTPTSTARFAPNERLACAGKGTASVHAKVPLVSVAADVFATAFRANFLPFWAHSMSHRLRACRLDAAQHEAIHGLNSATKLCSLLDTETALAVQRMALTHQSAGILTIEEVALMFGVEGVRGTSSNGGSKNPIDAARALGAAGSLLMAKLLCFARAAWICEELVVVELGPNTRRAQEDALLRRFGVQAGSHTTVKDLPIHATHLCTCTECRRIANALSIEPATDTTVAAPSASFNELGVSCSMLCTDAQGKSHLRCAKRSSAALRTAVQFEEEMHTRRIEESPLDITSIEAMFANQQTADAGIAARVRRDSKNAFEQRSVAVGCGEQPLFVLPIVGRVIRVWNEWYSLCTVCAALFRVFPNNKFGGDICCLRCDPKMILGGVQFNRLTSATSSTKKETLCRFCAKADAHKSGARWKEVKAPRDESGDNRSLPPPLRIVHYCPQHFRSWVPQAHRVLSTRVILSHLAINAKPIYGADECAAPEDRLDNEEDELLFQAKSSRKRRRKNKTSDSKTPRASQNTGAE